MISIPRPGFGQAGWSAEKLVKWSIRPYASTVQPETYGWYSTSPNVTSSICLLLPTLTGAKMMGNGLAASGLEIVVDFISYI